MASVAAAALPYLYSSSSSISRSSLVEISLPSSSSSFSFLPRTNNVSAKYHHLRVKRKKNFHGIITRVNAAIEEEEATGGTTTALVPEETAEAVANQTVTIPVSPADILTMSFEAEGTIKEADVPKVITALEKIEGVSDVDVRVDGRVATVLLTKKTVYLAKEVASELVELIQGCGFRLQTLRLGITDEQDAIEALANY